MEANRLTMKIKMEHNNQVFVRLVKPSTKPLCVP
ncbi:hypothetical protein J2X69_004005 [Algoriphagus sp. 4150]|nr:hypothetical protein [Algoriphagus sp. 4150]